MKSIWGVDHGVVAKSYIPGKGWVPAVQAGKQALQGAKGAHKAARGVTPKDAARAIQMKGTHAGSAGRGEGSGFKLFAPRRVDDIPLGRGMKAENWQQSNMPANFEAYAYMNGKRRIMMTKPGADKKFVNHEAAHLSPRKRKAHRLADIQADPVKSMREEARADMSAGMGFRGAPKNQLQALRAASRGDNYSGYATAARQRGQAKFQRRMGDAIDSQVRAQGRGDPNAVKTHRGDMFRQDALGAYRDVQDRIDAGRGIRHKDTAARITRRERVKDKVYPALKVGVPAVAAGGGGYAVYRSNKSPGSQRR